MTGITTGCHLFGGGQIAKTQGNGTRGGDRPQSEQLSHMLDTHS
jgi:hypothetical protein